MASLAEQFKVADANTNDTVDVDAFIDDKAPLPDEVRHSRHPFGVYPFGAARR